MTDRAQIIRAQELRTQMTKGEWNVWGRLRNRQVDGFKFRRQHPIGPVIVDFACPQARLVVEVDGPEHRPDDDARRDQLLIGLGWRVLRIDADLVFDHIDAVVDVIREELVRIPSATPPQPSPQAGRVVQR